MRKERKHYTSEEKVAILRRHLLDKVPVSDLCEEHGLQPTVFYRWQKEFFENGAAAFQGKSRPDHQGEPQRLDSPGFLATTVGETIHHPLLSGPSVGRLPTIDVHDAGRGCRGRQPFERLAGSSTSRVALAMEG